MVATAHVVAVQSRQNSQRERWAFLYANSVTNLLTWVVKIGIRIVSSDRARLPTNVPKLISGPENIRRVALAICDEGAISQSDQIGEKQETADYVSALTEVYTQGSVFEVLYIHLGVIIFL